MPAVMHFSSPGQRAAADEARLRARIERANKTPGPGAYDARRPAGVVDQTRPSSAFKSKTERHAGDAKAISMGDPGLYNPATGMELAARTAKTFSKSQQEGTGGFGTASKRAEISANSTAPGPGAYEIRQPSRPEAKQSSVFASKTNRSGFKKGETPGVGNYNPAPIGVDQVVGGVSAFQNKDARFKKEPANKEQDAVGPGTYTQDNLTIASKSKQSTDKTSSAFASGTLRDVFLGI